MVQNFYDLFGTGTTSQLMEVRRGDHSGDGFISWPFLTLQFWGENPTGEWTVIVSDQVSVNYSDMQTIRV